MRALLEVELDASESTNLKTYAKIAEYYYGEDNEENKELQLNMLYEVELFFIYGSVYGIVI